MAEVNARPLVPPENMGTDYPDNVPQGEEESREIHQPEEERGREPGEIARLMGRRRR